MRLDHVIAELATQVEGVIVPTLPETWTVHGFLPRVRAGWSPPAISFDNWQAPRAGGTLGTSLVNGRLIAVASETTVADVGESLYRWMSDDPGSPLVLFESLTSERWADITWLGTAIDDDLKIGQQSYRAALVSFGIQCR